MAKKSVDHKEEQLKPCFIITPIGQAGSDTFIKTEGLINSVLRPVLKEFGFEPKPAHQIDISGSITKQIIDNVINCELVIANLTEVNPNVMYELAIRHSFGKKVLILAEKRTKLPFDIQVQRTIFYEDSMHGSEELKPELRKKIESLLKESSTETRKNSPVYDAVQEVATFKGLPDEDRAPMSLILSKLNSLENSINTNTVISRPGIRYSMTKNIRSKFTHRLRIYVSKAVTPEQSFEEITNLLVSMGIESSGLSIDKSVDSGKPVYLLRTNIVLPDNLRVEDIDSRIGYITGVYRVSFSEI